MIADIDIASIIAPEVYDFEVLATAFAKSRFLALSAEFNSNAEEAEEIENIADHIVCKISNDSSSFALSLDYIDDSNYFELINKGSPAPLAGGDNGIAHNPDGTPYYSRVPEQLWGTRLDFLARQGIDIIGETKQMLLDLFKDRITEAIQAAKQRIAEAFKPMIAAEFAAL